MEAALTTQARRPLVAGNWKMNGLAADGLALAAAVRSLHGMSATQRQIMGDSGRDYLLGNCTLDIVWTAMSACWRRSAAHEPSGVVLE